MLRSSATPLNRRHLNDSHCPDSGIFLPVNPWILELEWYPHNMPQTEDQQLPPWQHRNDHCVLAASSQPITHCLLEAALFGVLLAVLYVKKRPSTGARYRGVRLWKGEMERVREC